MPVPLVAAHAGWWGEGQGGELQQRGVINARGCGRFVDPPGAVLCGPRGLLEAS